MNILQTSILICSACYCTLAPSACGQEGVPLESDTNRAKTETELWKEFCNLTAKNLTLFEPSKRDQLFERVEHPIFEHRNAVDGDVYGFVFLWKQKSGRPVGIMANMVQRIEGTGRWREVFEDHSLHDGPLVLHFDGQSVWRPAGRGLDWKEIPKAPTPATSARQLKVQAGVLARRFHVDATYGNAKTDRLRALPRPVYSYETEMDGQLVAGTLTFFCKATDPEALLAIEVQQKENGEYAWHYAPGNFAIGKTVLYLDGKEVWSEDSLANRDKLSVTYRHFGGFPFSGFTLEEGIARQKSHLEN